MKRAVTMRKALADPQLLGNAIAGDSWSTWRTFLIAMQGERLTAAEREVFQRFTGREREPGERVEEALFLIGRRGGKDVAASVLASYLAALTDWTPVLRRGERGLVLCIAPDTRQAAITADYIAGIFASSPILGSLVAGRTSDVIELTNNISVEVRAASFRRLRGVTCVAVIASEAAFWASDEGSSNPDSEILNSVRPSLSTTHGPLCIISTPYAQRGEVFSIYKQHFGADGDPLVLVAQGTSRDFNPTLSQKVIDRAMARDPAAASAEYLARFRSDVAAYVSRQVVEAAVQAGRFELAPIAGASYVAFVDPSGGSSDSMCVAIARREGDRGVLCATREVKPPFSPDEVCGEFAALLRHYRINKVVGDAYAGEWPRERFRVHGINYELSEHPKSQIYLQFLPYLMSGRVELLDDPRLLAQLVNLERRTARGGRESIDHAPRQRDDLINCAAGALTLALDQAAGWVFTPATVQQILRAGTGERAMALAARARGVL